MIDISCFLSRHQLSEIVDHDGDACWMREGRRRGAQ
jgi:hypothetical protein